VDLALRLSRESNQGQGSINSATPPPKSRIEVLTLKVKAVRSGAFRR
jgi:hypothetical protein